MPGKGPTQSFPEFVNQVAFEVIRQRPNGDDGGGVRTLQLKRVRAIIAHSLFKSIKYLRAPVSRWKNAV